MRRWHTNGRTKPRGKNHIGLLGLYKYFSVVSIQIFQRCKGLPFQCGDQLLPSESDINPHTERVEMTHKIRGEAERDNIKRKEPLSLHDALTLSTLMSTTVDILCFC